MTTGRSGLLHCMLPVLQLKSKSQISVPSGKTSFIIRGKPDPIREIGVPAHCRDRDGDGHGRVAMAAMRLLCQGDAARALCFRKDAKLQPRRHEGGSRHYLGVAAAAKGCRIAGRPRNTAWDIKQGQEAGPLVWQNTAA